MEKKYAFLVALLVTLLVAGNYLFFNAKHIFPEREVVIVERVMDGDTVKLKDGRTIRLLNINAPEKDQAFAMDSTNFLKNFQNKTLKLETNGIDKYGRTLGRIYSDKYLNLELVRLGLVHQYLCNKDELKKFREIEKEARESNLGIWKKSEHYNCLNIEINKNEDYVIIKDKCGLNFLDWTVKDESTRDYKFKSDFEEIITLYSNSGIDNDKKLYWERGKVWNDDKDSIFIRDEKGFLVYYNSYGY